MKKWFNSKAHWFVSASLFLVVIWTVYYTLHYALPRGDTLAICCAVFYLLFVAWGAYMFATKLRYRP